MNEENNNNSELEAFFKNRLNANVTPGEGWDNPPEDVLSNAFDIMDEKKKKRFGFFWVWVITGVAISAFIAGLMWNANKLNEMDGKISALIQQNELKESQPNHNVVEVGDAEKIQVQAESDQSTLETDIETRRHSSGHDAKTYEVAQQPTKHKVEADENLIKAKDDGSTKSLFSAIDKVENSIADTDKQATELVETSLPTIKVDEKSDSTSPTLPFESTSSKSFYALIGGNTSTLSMSALVPLPDNLKQYDNWYSGYQMGIGFTQNLKPKKLSVDMKLKYLMFRNNSEFTNSSAYAKSNETTNTSGETVYNTSVDVESPFGGFNNNIAVGLENFNISSGELLGNTTNISNTFHMTAAEVGLVYDLYGSKKLTLSAYAAAGVNYVVEMKEELNYQLSYQDRVMTTERFKQASKENLSTVFGSATLGLKLNKDVTSKLYWGINTGYTRSLQSVRRVEGAMRVKTHVSLIQASLNFGYRL